MKEAFKRIFYGYRRVMINGFRRISVRVVSCLFHKGITSCYSSRQLFYAVLTLAPKLLCLDLNMFKRNTFPVCL